MASQQQVERVGFKTVKLFKDQVLGIGSYGKVCKAKCDDLLCAAKLMHETLFDPTAQQLIAAQREHRLPIRRFEQECEFMSSIRHPNIVQYLGLYRDVDTGLPALLMELMDNSLTHFVERCTQPIPYHIQANICHDITVALSFLHSNNIVHRDLSSNNVLLIGDVRAKVTDFGMARLGDGNPQATQLTFTMCPGTDVYMPPEAVQDKPVYSEKIDCFSFGVITLQILTREFPKPGDRRKEIEIYQPGIPSGTVAEVRLPETERRQNHISRIDPNHTLLQVALLCLKDRAVERPSAQQLCERVAALKVSSEYSESVRAVRERSIAEQSRDGEREREVRLLREENCRCQETIQDQLNRLEEKDQTIIEKDQSLREKDDMIAAEQQQVREKVRENSRLEREKDQLIEEKERQLRRVNQQLVESEQVIAQFQRRITELEQLRPTTDVSSRNIDESSSSRARIKMTWREGRKAPCKMSSSYDAVADDTAMYVRTGSKKVYAYLTNTSSWSQLPDRPTYSCPSVIVNNLLTLVGGLHSHTITNQLFSLTGEGSGKRWTEKLPPMLTKRWGSIALCTGTALIVAGGMNKSDVPFQTVEVMNTENLHWSTAADLPQPLWCAPGAICGDYVYILSLASCSKSMYTCPVSTLIQSCRSRPTADVWNRVAAPPVTHTTCVSSFGQLLTFGGNDSNLQSTTAVHMYNPTTDSWEVVSHMRIPRYDCFAAALPNNQLIVVGGFRYRGETDSVEVAIVELQH